MNNGANLILYTYLGIDGLTPPGKSKTEIPFDDPSSSTQLDLSMWSYVALLAVTVCNLLF